MQIRWLFLFEDTVRRF